MSTMFCWKGWQKTTLSCFVTIWTLFSVAVGNPETWPRQPGYPPDPFDPSSNHRSTQYEHHQYHPLKTRIGSVKVGSPDDVQSHHQGPYIHGPHYSRYENRYIENSVEKDSREQPTSYPRHHDNERTSVRHRSTSQTNGYDQIIHSVVIEGNFEEAITREINRTTEYLIEFIYNATELAVSLL